MVGWLYIGESLAAPIRLLEIDALTGMVTIEIATKFVPYRSELRGRTVVEYRDWKRRREIRCLGAEEVGSALLIEAVDIGLSELGVDEDPDERGLAEDWLVVDGKACCQVRGFRVGNGPGSLVGHSVFNIPLEDWRDLRIGENAPLARVGLKGGDVSPSDSSITPLLHASQDSGPDAEPPKVEVVRLRERVRYLICPIATDWGESTTLVVNRVQETLALGQTPAAAPAGA